MGGVGEDRFTNVSNIHTCTICRPDLIIAGVALVHGQALDSTVMWSMVSESRYQLGSLPMEEDAMVAT
jgi:hypothetical protein